MAPDEVATFARDGVVILPAILDPALVAAMDAPVERALSSRTMADLGALAGATSAPERAEGEAASSATPPVGTFSGGIDHWRSDDDFRRFACASPLPAIAAALLGSERVWLYEDSVLVKEPGTPFRTEFHTDAGYFHVRGDQACTFWVPLDPASPETGSVEYVTGSHRWQREFRPNLFTIADPIPGTEGETVPDVLGDPALARRLVGFSVEPGDVVVHHYRTLHGAPGNASATTRRRAISVRYCGDDIRYHLRPGAPRKPHHAAVAEGDPLGGPDCPQVWGPPA